jgi:uncharacterized protein DUF1706
MAKETPSAQQLTSAVDAFLEYFSTLPQQRLRSSTGTSWGPREVLIHLVFWHEQYARITESITRGQTPTLLQGTFKEWNAKATQLERRTTVDELLGRFKAANSRLIAIAEHRNARALSFCFREGSKSWLYDDALVAISRHIRGHIEKLRRSERRGNDSRRRSVAR